MRGRMISEMYLSVQREIVSLPDHTTSSGLEVYE